MPQPALHPPVIQIVGYKNSGKTTLLCRLVERLKADRLTVGTVKHDAHDFTMDQPGTDTWQHQQAGADLTAISSSRRTAWLMNRPAELQELLAGMHGVDLVLAEGFKTAPYPKLILLRQESDLELLQLANVTAAVQWPSFSAERIPASPGLPVFPIDGIEPLYRLVRTLAGI
ncbi:molybdopterin-guanine dinucleotide biosynthesis protein B [Paenibacillus sambharensis]|uniref:Molybdopterin-guanine dinucleotide biosynthesis protein B n=1 Tax=Paenibacillus sambharensis TaxID=1803190 RepID=A0A2W1LEW9_9BACL|nr:molybdopterin-guanine dinucleotide biosynthesis protein B [Paenibacillus sambharensis]PZD92934.1 molybdopterin-guanine dinucleotide biosynthesis protein B [Paenibacillus sambharensis]